MELLTIPTSYCITIIADITTIGTTIIIGDIPIARIILLQEKVIREYTSVD